MRYILFLFAFSSLFAIEHPRPNLPPPESPSPYMTGNWDGWRDTFENNGVTFTSSYLTEMVGNPTGGKARGFTYTGSFGLNLNIDFDKALNWNGLSLYTSMAWRTGTSLSKTKIGNQFPVQELYGGQTVKLNELYLHESLFEDSLALKVGRLNGCNDFLISPLYCQFLNLAFCGNPVSILYNTAFTDYPFAQWGAYVHFRPHSDILIKGGIYNGNTEVNRNKYHGLNFTFSSTNGVIWIAEADILNNSDTYPGSYRAGFFYQTANTVIFSGGVGGDPGYYFQIDQTIYPGITPFLAMIFQPRDRNLLPLFLSSGTVFKGILSSRPNDALSLGFAYGKFSSDLHPRQNYEAVLEATYWFQVNPWFSIIPDAQYILHPKGIDIPNAFCLGIQMGFIL